MWLVDCATTPDVVRKLMEIEYVKLWQCRWSASGVRRSSNQHQQQPVADEPQNGTSDMYVRSRSFFLPHCSLSPCDARNPTLLQRDKLRRHPAVILAMKQWWNECRHPVDDVVHFENYCVLYRRLMSELTPVLDASKVGTHKLGSRTACHPNCARRSRP